jgi:hypothetical protein
MYPRWGRPGVVRRGIYVLERLLRLVDDHPVETTGALALEYRDAPPSVKTSPGSW